jgi:heat shock protein 4
VRDFAVIDYTPHPISISWISGAAAEEDVDESMLPHANEERLVAGKAAKSVIVFPRKSPMNVTKVLTFYRNAPFEMSAEYADSQMLPIGTSPLLGKYTVAVPASAENHKVKVRAKLSVHGTFSVENASLVEIEEYEEIVKELVPVAEDAEEGTEPKEIEVVHKKKRERKTDVKVTSSHTNGLSQETLRVCLDAESRMAAIDREARDRDNARNDLETYIYDMREKISNAWAEYVSAQERETLTEVIIAAEDWLYDRFEEGAKVEFADKLVELRAKFANVKAKHDEEEARKNAAVIESPPPPAEGDVNMTESKVDDVD